MQNARSSQFLRNSLVGSGHNLLEGDGGFLRAFAFLGFGPLSRRTLNRNRENEKTSEDGNS